MNMRVSWPMRLVDYGFRRAYQVAYPILCYCKRFYRADGVVIAVWAQGRLLVVRHSYKPGMSIPGGGKRRKETPSEAAIRELGEEVGTAVRDAVERAGVRLLMSREYKPNGATNYFLESTIAFEPTLLIDRREIIYAKFIEPAEFSRSAADRYFAAYLDLMEQTLKNAA